MAIKVNSIVRHNGEFYHPGDIIEKIQKKEAARLIEKKLGEEIVLEVSDTVEDKEPEKLGHVETTEETLDLNFNTTELKDGAKEQGLDFKANISKKEIIDLIVSAEKVEYFLEQLED